MIDLNKRRYQNTYQLKKLLQQKELIKSVYQIRKTLDHAHEILDRMDLLTTALHNLRNNNEK